MSLTPPDRKQCQADVPGNGPFTMGGEIGDPKNGYRVRCKNEPVVIAYEVEPGPDGLMGAMSLCPKCLEAFRRLMPDMKVRLEHIDDGWYRKQAKKLYHDAGRVEVDEGTAKVSRPDNEGGAYVEAWVWVSAEEEENDT
jgi:hypothetical protein